MKCRFAGYFPNYVLFKVIKGIYMVPLFDLWCIDIHLYFSKHSC